jgi:hypothetical protein
MAVPLLIVVACSLAACSRDEADYGDMSKERDTVDTRVCIKKSLRDVESALDELDFEYQIHEDRRYLVAIKRYERNGLVSPAITVEVRLDEGEVVESCSVALVFTGP